MTAKFERAFFFLLDGARTDIFEELLARGDLPNIARHLVEPGGYRPATTVFPTGVYFKGGTYGTDLNFPIPFDEVNNPQFHGCIDRNA